MTLFGFYRILEYPGTLKLKTITDPGKSISQGFLSSYNSFVREFLRMLSAKGNHRLLDREPGEVMVPEPLPIVSVSANSLPGDPRKDLEPQSSYESRRGAARCWLKDLWGDYLWNFLWHLQPVESRKTFYSMMEDEWSVDKEMPISTLR